MYFYIKNDQQLHLAAEETARVRVYYRPVSVPGRTLNFVTFLSRPLLRVHTSCLSVTVCPHLSACPSPRLSKKRIRPRLSGFDLQANLLQSQNRGVPAETLRVTPARRRRRRLLDAVASVFLRRVRGGPRVCFSFLTRPAYGRV